MGGKGNEWDGVIGSGRGCEGMQERVRKVVGRCERECEGLSEKEWERVGEE